MNVRGLFTLLSRFFSFSIGCNVVHIVCHVYSVLMVVVYYVFHLNIKYCLRGMSTCDTFSLFFFFSLTFGV